MNNIPTDELWVNEHASRITSIIRKVSRFRGMFEESKKNVKLILN